MKDLNWWFAQIVGNTLRLTIAILIGRILFQDPPMSIISGVLLFILAKIPAIEEKIQEWPWTKKGFRLAILILIVFGVRLAFFLVSEASRTPQKLLVRPRDCETELIPFSQDGAILSQKDFLEISTSQAGILKIIDQTQIAFEVNNESYTNPPRIIRTYDGEFEIFVTLNQATSASLTENEIRRAGIALSKSLEQPVDGWIVLASTNSPSGYGVLFAGPEELPRQKTVDGGQIHLWLQVRDQTVRARYSLDGSQWFPFENEYSDKVMQTTHVVLFADSIGDAMMHVIFENYREEAC